ncbi:hypothetical protein MY8738_006811 [Beauveria namnaoensis]
MNYSSKREAATLKGNLETQILSSRTHQPVKYFAVGPNSDPDNLSDDELVSSQLSAPNSVFASYGGKVDGLSSQHLDHICKNFVKASSHGLSMFFSSGDFGVVGYGKSNCN